MKTIKKSKIPSTYFEHCAVLFTHNNKKEEEETKKEWLMRVKVLCDSGAGPIPPPTHLLFSLLTTSSSAVQPLPTCRRDTQL